MKEFNAHATKKPREEQDASSRSAALEPPFGSPTALPDYEGQRILLHACCGPCSMEPVRLLKERGFAPTIFFANSNISPACEYERRLDTLKGFAALEGIDVVEGCYDPDAWEQTAGRIGDAAREKFGVIADEHAAEFAHTKEAERGGTQEAPSQTPRTESSVALCETEEIIRETNPLDRIPNVGNTTNEARLARAARCRACYRMRFEEAAIYAAAQGYPLLGTTLSVSPYQHTHIILEELQRAARQANVKPLFEDYRPYYDNATQRSKDAGMYRQNYCGCRFSDEEATAERTARKAERKLLRVAEKLAAAKVQAAALPPYIDPAQPGDAFPLDPIPHEDDFRFTPSEGGGPHTCTFRAFNTVVELIAYGATATTEQAFEQAVSTCRSFERRLSAHLPHSDIARLNAGKGNPCPIHEDTAELLSASLDYCSKSQGTLDITIGRPVRLWDFRTEAIPDPVEMQKALEHVDWRKVNVFRKESQWFAHIADPCAHIDLGSMAKGWIADRLATLATSDQYDIEAISINLGGNVIVCGNKPGGDPWLIGIRDPRQSGNEEQLLATLPLHDASIVTSGTYERCFTASDGATYHHILSTQDGWPVRTDLASATVIAKRSIDAEGFSTTLLALGLERALEFAAREPSIIAAILVEPDGTMHQA